jgi:PAS domain S-box-containing protein
MDAVVSVATSPWELLAQLASFGHAAEPPRSAAAALQRVADLLQRALSCPWGVIVTVDQHGASEAIGWGLSAAEQRELLARNGQYVRRRAARFDLPTGAAQPEYLLLAKSEAGTIDSALGAALAAQIALLVELARRRATERLASAIQQLARAANGHAPLAELLDLVLAQAAAVAPYARASLLLSGEDFGRADDALALAASHARGDAPPPPPNPDAYRAALSNPSPAIVTDASGALLAPLLAPEGPLGLLLVQPNADSPFRPAEREALAELAAQAAHSLASLRRYNQQQQRARELFVLFENSQVISTTDQLAAMLHRVVENIAIALGADCSAVALLDVDDPNTLQVVATYGFDGDGDPIGATYALPDEPELHALLASDAPQAIDDIAERYASGEEADNPTLVVLHTLGLRSGVLLPLRVKERALGLLGVGYNEARHAFSRSEINLAATLTNQLATAVANAQFAAAEQRRAAELELLQSTSQQLSADLSIEETLQAIVAGVYKLASPASMEITLFNAPDGRFDSVRSLNGSPPVPFRTYHADEGLTGWLARHHRALRLADVTQYTPEPLVAETIAGGQAVRSYLGVPLQVGDELVGTLELVSPRPNSFVATDERLLTILAGQAARAIRNAQRYEAADEHLRERIQQLTALQRVSSQLTIMVMLADILAFVLQQARKATSASHGYIVFDNAKAPASWKHGSGYTVIAVDGYDAEARDALVDLPLDVRAATTLAALQSGEPGLSSNLGDEERAAIACPARSALAVPIFYEAEVVGTISLFSTHTRGFDHDALQFVRAMADQSSLAIGNAQRYNDQVRLNELLQRRATMLNNVLEIGAALRADRPIEEMLEQVGYSMIETTGFRIVIFNLIDRDNPQQLRVVSAAGIPLEELDRMRQGTFPMELALRFIDPRFRVGRSFFIPEERMPEVVAGYNIDPIYYVRPLEAQLGNEWHTADELFVPMYATDGSGLLGLISVGDPIDRQRPTARTVEPLEIFAEQAAIALENLFLVRSARDQADQMTALYQVSAAVASTLDHDAMLERVFRQIVSYLGVPSICFIAAYDPEREMLAFQMVWKDGELQTERPLVPKAGLSSWVIDQGQTLLVSDIEAERERLPVPVMFMNTSDDIRSWMGVPLRSQNRVNGVLSVQHVQPDHYNERDAAFLSTLGNTLGIALGNVELFQERERRIVELDTINRIGNIISSTLNLEQMLGQIYDCLADFLPLDSFYAMIYRADRGEIVFSYTVDGGAQRLRALAVSPEENSMSERIIQTRQPLLFRNLAAERPADLRPMSFGDSERESASWLGVPLLVGEGEVVGVLSVQSYTPGLYGERERSFLSTVASQIALGVQNARLFVDREQRIVELDTINRIGGIVNATLNMEQMLPQVYDCLTSFLPVDAGYIYIYNAERNEITIRFDADEGQQTTLSEPFWPAPASLTERIIKTRQSLLFRDLRHERAQQQITTVPIGNHAKRSASWLGVPLVVGDGKVVGVLSVQSYTPGLYGERERAFLSTIANQLAVGVQNAQLFGERDRQIVELDTLGRIGRVTSSALELRPITEGLYPVLRQALGASNLSLAVADQRRDRVVVVTITQGGGLVEDELPLSDELMQSMLAGIVVQRNEPLAIADVREPPDDLAHVELPFDGQTPRPLAYLAAPLVALDSRPIGALIVAAAQSDAFGERERAFLRNVAAQVSLGVQNATLYAQAQQQVQQLALLNRVSSVAASTLALEEIYRAGIDALSQALDVDHVALLMYDRPAGVAHAVAAYRADEGEVRSSSALPPQSIVGSVTMRWLEANQRVLVATDALQDPRLQPYHAQLRRGGVQSLLLVPLIVGREMIGVATLSGVGRALRFAEQQLELCQTIANQTATAIKNVRLFQETQANTVAIQHKVEELSTLLDAARILSSSLQPNEVLGRLMDLVSRQLNVSTVALWTIGSNNVMTPAAMEGIPQEVARTLEVPVGQGMTGVVAASEQPLIVVDVNEEGASLYPSFNRDNRLTSFMGVPVIYRERTIGVLSVMTIERRAFSDDEMLLLVGLADQAAIALENARLFEQREQRIAELTTLNHISGAMNATLSQDELLVALHAGIAEVIDASHSFIGLYDGMSAQLSFPVARVEGRDITDLPPQIVSDPSSLVARVVLEMRPLLLGSANEIAQLTGVAPDDAAPLASFLGVPIVQGVDVLGMIAVQSAQPFAFDADDERFLTTVASQASTAIARARLFGERERRLGEVTALKDIGSAMVATLDLEPMLEHLYRELGRVVDVSTALIGLYDAERDTLSYPVCYDEGQRVFFAAEPLGQGVSGWVIRNQAPLLLNNQAQGNEMGLDLANLERAGAPGREEESFLAVPIISGDTVLGLISIQSYQQYAFDSDDLRFVTTAANQAAVAISNARLFTERERRIEELATFNEIGQALSATVSYEELPELIYRQTSRLLDSTNFYMALIDERRREVFFPLYIERGQRLEVEPLRESDSSLTAYVVRTRETLLLQGADLPAQLARIGAEPQGEISRSWLGVPMINADRVVGVIGIQDFERDTAYSADDVRLLSTIASWAGTAIANARLIQAELNRRRLADTLRDVAQSFTSTLALDEIQTLILNQLARVVPYHTAAVLLRDENVLRVTAAWGYGSETVGRETVIDENPLFRDMAASRQPVSINDVQTMLPNLGVPGNVLLNGAEHLLGCWIGAPLLVDDELVGVLVVGSVTPDAYGAEETQIAFALASQASQAIQNARYVEQLADIASDLEGRVVQRTADLEEEKARLEAVHAITLELTSTLDRQEILSKALDRVCSSLGASRGSVMLKDSENGELMCRAVRFDSGEVRIVHLPITFGEGGGLAQWVLMHQEPARIGDVRRDKRWVMEPGRAEEVRSVVAVPLIANNEPLGVLSISSPKLNFFNEPQVRLLSTIANQIAIAVNNAQLYTIITDYASALGEQVERERESSSKTRAILQSVTEGVIVLDEDEQVVLFNPAAEQVLGIPALAVRDKSLASLADQGDTINERKRAGLIYAGLRAGLDGVKQRRGIYSVPLELPEPSQTIAVNLARVVGNDGRTYGNVAVLRDITREIESERTKREFVSKVSHELRTPLTPIKGYVDLLISGVLGQLNEAQSSSLGVVKTNANRLADLINDILDISKIEAQGMIDLNVTRVQLGAVIADVVQSLRLESERKHMQVIVAVPEDLPEVAGDKKRLTQVFFNLYSNAVKYTFDGGTITVRAFRNPAGLLQVEVEDTGVGMSPEQQEKLFLPFYRADNPLRDEVGGTGLGLSIAKSLVEQHGGEMWVTSEQGVGSIFHFVLPVDQVQQPNPDGEAA